MPSQIQSNLNSSNTDGAFTMVPCKKMENPIKSVSLIYVHSGAVFKREYEYAV